MIDRSKCRHKWQPISFVFESQLRGMEGEVRIKQPSLERGRVYCICMKCASHTYIDTKWIQYHITPEE